MALVGTTTSTSDASTIIDDRSCLGLGSVGDVTIYSHTGYVAMRGNQSSTPNAVRADVAQLVTSLPSPPTRRLYCSAHGRIAARMPRTADTAFTRRTANHSYFDTHGLRGSGSRIEVSMRGRRRQVGMLARDGRRRQRRRRRTGLLAQ